MNKTTKIILLFILILTGLVYIFNEPLSLYFAKNKPDNIIYIHDSWYVDEALEGNYTDLRENILGSFYYYISKDELLITQLVKGGFLDYKFIDVLPTAFENSNSTTGTGNQIPSKTIEYTTEYNTVSIECKRVIINAMTYNENNTITYDDQSLLSCMVDDVIEEMMYIGTSGKTYNPIFVHSVNSDTLLIFRIDKYDLYDLDDLSEESFDVNYNIN